MSDLTVTTATPQKVCRTCQESKPATAFRPYKRSPDGLAGTCRSCRDATNRPAARRKKCVRCKLVRNPGDYHPHPGRADGVTRLCRHCHALITEELFDARMRIQKRREKDERLKQAA